MNSLKITTLDIATFFYNQDMRCKKKSEIIIDLWSNRYKYLEYYIYDDIRIFSNEINNLLMDISFNNIIFNEINDIRVIQQGLESDYTGYKFRNLNSNMMESYLKQCKLRIKYDSKQGYIYMKMRTLVKACGYKRRTIKMIDQLIQKLSELRLYIYDGYKKLKLTLKSNERSLMNIKMDQYIRIYNY